MASQTPNQERLVLIIGGTGAQGLPIIDQLTNRAPEFRVRVMTRNPENPRAVDLRKNPRVEIIQGDATNEDDLQRAFSGVYGAFVNLDGFVIGEKLETYWGIRCWEIARQHNVKHYVWGNLDYTLPASGWSNRCGHYDGKGRVGQFLTSFPSTPDATWSILTSGPYADMLTEFLRPVKSDDGTYVFEYPFGPESAFPMIGVDDLGVYARWIFDHPEEASGLDLKACMGQVTGPALAETFTKVTGKPARFKSVSLSEWFSARIPNPDALLAPKITDGMTWRQNFTGAFTLWGNGYCKRNFAFLDNIHPNRQNLEAWMRATGYDGEYKPLLKDREDRQRELALATAAK
ncbi:hypothetical protein FRB99_001100 [Tulasnella sp. 403]|nr:hypothetical protein FRB99_001100 [Tulasnella sp. 403]